MTENNTKAIVSAEEVEKKLWSIMGHETEEVLRDLESLGWLAKEEPVEVRNWCRSKEVVESGFLDTDTVGWTGNGLPRFPTVEFGEGHILLCTKAQKERFLRLRPDALLGIGYGNRFYAIAAEDIDEILVVDEAPEEIPESKSSLTIPMPRPTRPIPRPVSFANRR
jgi:hypothetical protein